MKQLESIFGKESLAVKNTVFFVKKILNKAEAGHDWWHLLRVYNNCILLLPPNEKVDAEVIKLAALLHDVADSKFNIDSENAAALIIDHLDRISISDPQKKHILDIIQNISYQDSFDESAFYSEEFGIVQDADRLDALGAIGVARAFSYGGYRGNPFYDPEILPLHQINRHNYLKRNSPTINHFYEKLFLLKDLMNTERGKALAQERHAFLRLYVETFMTEAGIDPAIYENSR